MADPELEGEDFETQGGVSLLEDDAEDQDFDLWEEELGHMDPDATAEEDPEELEHQRNNSEKAKIDLPETIIVTLLALFADAVEFLTASANIIPVLGQAIWFVGWILGICISIILILWTFLRGVYGAKRAAKFAVFRIMGFLGDSVIFGGWLPIRTFVLLITIWLNNHLEEKEIKRVAALLGE